jgi:AcrR family transcriptional regulator
MEKSFNQGMIMKREAIRRHSETTKNKLLFAAKNLLANEGYTAFSENKICELVGVTRGALRHHFPAGRHELISELAISFMEQVPVGDTSDIQVRIIELITFMHQKPHHNPLVLLMEIFLASYADKQLEVSVKTTLDSLDRIIFGVDSWEALPEHLTPFPILFWGTLLAQLKHGKNSCSLNAMLGFMNTH